jgi:hypothetical protein
VHDRRCKRNSGCTSRADVAQRPIHNAGRSYPTIPWRLRYE